MPFNIGGEWVPSRSLVKGNSKPVKVRLVKRGKSLLTLILNLPLSEEELFELVSSFKKKLGCGGTVKEGEIEIQGDKVEQVKKLLAEKQIKSS